MAATGPGPILLACGCLVAPLATPDAASVTVPARSVPLDPPPSAVLSAMGTVITALRAWGDKWAIDAPPPSTFEHTCGHDLDPMMICRHCGEEVHPDDLKVKVVTPGWTRQGPSPAD